MIIALWTGKSPRGMSPLRQAVTIFLALAVLSCLLVFCPNLSQYVLAATPDTNSALDAKATVDPYWDHAHAEIHKSFAALLARSQTEHGQVPTLLPHGDVTAKEIAFTFDDGPHPNFTPRLLAVLRLCNVKATFFVVGEMAAKYPAYILDELADGHLVGNHTFHHVNLKKLSQEDVAIEIKACDEVLKDITGQSAHLFRPPGGDYSTKVTRVARALGYTTVLWTDDPADYAKPGCQAIKARLYRKLTNGGIILLHDGIEQTLTILPELIADLRSKGYRIVSLEDMLKKHPAE